MITFSQPEDRDREWAIRYGIPHDGLMFPRHEKTAFVVRDKLTRNELTVLKVCSIPYVYTHIPLNRSGLQSEIVQYGNVWGYGVEHFVTRWFENISQKRFVCAYVERTAYNAHYMIDNCMLMGYLPHEVAAKVNELSKTKVYDVAGNYWYGMPTPGRAKLLTQKAVDGLLEFRGNEDKFQYFVMGLQVPIVSPYWFKANQLYSMSMEG